MSIAHRRLGRRTVDVMADDPVPEEAADQSVTDEIAVDALDDVPGGAMGAIFFNRQNAE